MEWIYFRKRRMERIFPVPYWFAAFTKKTAGVPVGPILNIYFGQDKPVPTLMGIINAPGAKRVQGHFLKKVMQNPGFLAKQVAGSRAEAKKYVGWCKQELRPEKLAQLDNSSLGAMFDKFRQRSQSFTAKNTIWWVFLADSLAQAAAKEFIKHGLPEDKTEATINAIITPLKVPYVQRENIDFLKLLYYLKTRKLYPFKSLRALSANKTAYKKLKSQVEKYYWIQWSVEKEIIWDERHYLKKVLKCHQEKVNPQAQLQKIKTERRKAHSDQQKLLKKYKISPKSRQLIKALQAQATLQDDKQANSTEVQIYLARIMREAGKRTRVPWKDLLLLSFEEIKQLLQKKNTQDILTEIKQREKFALIRINEGSVKVFSGPEAAAIIDRDKVVLKEKIPITQIIEGTAAYPGKVVGKVRFLVNASYISQLKKGEILVATMCTPRYVQAMRLAKAIVTDEGGISCHAAVISREFKIPCITNTKIGTQVLKTGDKVEVDANRGIIKKLS